MRRRLRHRFIGLVTVELKVIVAIQHIEQPDRNSYEPFELWAIELRRYARDRRIGGGIASGELSPSRPRA
jgi:hypothetical protein